ncbi:uncharacterized protein PV07_12675 [Cladophialophora immunda]|uniref:Uncharacterized protein n=1 Tax=Cladophialophora immunda TaxID=569365 RepID=A0A0D1Z2Q7_9EURO|nr:uncharacterized protein PV07_12675 [Cladophialophora immunda]KIW21916.1 hypothetical protein PV07_12675 [Cladophialophora immunda]
MSDQNPNVTEPPSVAQLLDRAQIIVEHVEASDLPAPVKEIITAFARKLPAYIKEWQTVTTTSILAARLPELQIREWILEINAQIEPPANDVPQTASMTDTKSTLDIAGEVREFTAAIARFLAFPQYVAKCFYCDESASRTSLTALAAYMYV